MSEIFGHFLFWRICKFFFFPVYLFQKKVKPNSKQHRNRGCQNKTADNVLQ